MSAIVLPSSVRDIADDAFHNCSNLITVTSKPIYYVPSLSGSAFDSAVSRTLIVPKGMKGMYEESNWKDYFTTILEE